jgi:O-antigen/teichoic acid export membrane protein
VFITRFDFNGAALATVVAEATSVMLLLAYFTINVVRIQVNIKIVAVITAGILTGICTYFLRRVVNLWSFPVGAGFYLIQILLFRILSKDDLKVFISAFRSES